MSITPQICSRYLRFSSSASVSRAILISSDNSRRRAAIRLYEDWQGGVRQILRAVTCNEPSLVRVWQLLEIAERPIAREQIHAFQQLGLIRVEDFSVLAVLEVPIAEALAKGVMASDDEVKGTALQALSIFGRPFPAVIPVLIAALNSPTDWIRRRAARAFAAMAGAEGVFDESEFRSLDDADSGVQKSIHSHIRARQVFAVAAAENGVPALIHTLNDDPSGPVRSWVAITLGRLERFAPEYIAGRLKDAREEFNLRARTEGQDWLTLASLWNEDTGVS